MNRISQTIATLLLTTGLLSAALAAELPAYYPKSFDNTGTINDLVTTPNQKSIVISDKRYVMAPSVVVHSPLVKTGGATLLKSGQNIGFTLSSAGASADRVVSEVWVFPAGYAPAK